MDVRPWKIVAVLAALLMVVGCAQFHRAGGSDDDAYGQGLGRLRDQNDLIAAADRLFICTDNKDWACVQDVFAPEVLFDMTSLAGGQPEKKTPEQIAALWEQGLRPIQVVHHQAGNYQVAVKGNEADLYCYATAWHYLPNPTNQNTRIFVGSYNEHFVRGEKGWKMDRFKYNLKFIDGNRDLEAAAKK